jgi:preprotein translocase subunit SecG
MVWTNIAIDILLFFFVIDCLLMCLVVLMQRSKQEGLGAAFGGGFTESVWGAQTSNVLVKATVILAAGFFIISISLAKLYSIRAAVLEKGSPLQQELMKPVAPVTATPAVVPAPTTATTNATPMTETTVVVPATASATATTNAVAPAAPAKPADK